MSYSTHNNLMFTKKNSEKGCEKIAMWLAKNIGYFCIR